MALELFKPFIYNKLEERGLVATIKQAKEMVEEQRSEVWDVLEDVIREHPVLLNRAPTLHRLGIQAFEPVLVEGKAIRIHPLVCTAFNADFDGDQMAVHIPLSPEAQIEASVLMLSSNNVLSPANGAPIAVPSQDIVLGCYYLTKAKPGAIGEGRLFANLDDVIVALEMGELETLTPIRLRYSGQLIDLTLARDDQSVLHTPQQEVERRIINTTVGRVIFNSALPEGMPFINGLLKKKGLQQAVQYCHLHFGIERTVQMLDSLKTLGFTYATRSGMSIGINDLIIPRVKHDLVEHARSEVIKVEQQYQEGAITNGERYNKVIALWSEATEKIADKMFSEMEELDRSGQSFNPVYIMADSGARGSKQQIRQLAGMRGLMAKPSGEIIETPITSNFREGLTVLQYFISTHGARKGLADTALKTADSGYLTRRLVDVAQDVIIHEDDCGTMDGIEARPIVEAGETIEPLRDRIVGRVAVEAVIDPVTRDVLVAANQEITEDLATDVQEAGIEMVKIRSVLTCASRRGVCAKCYGRDLATGRMVEKGMAVGVIAAQSIGEPGTQLTMRTFHIGGTASRISEQSTQESRHAGVVRFEGLSFVEATTVAGVNEFVVMNRNGSVVVQDAKGRDVERYQVIYGARLRVRDGQKVEPGQILLEWDPYTFSILTEDAGTVKFKDIIDGVTVHEEVDEVTGLSRRIVIETIDEKKQPLIEIRDADGKVLRKYHIPSHAHLMVDEGESVKPGAVLAKIPRETTKTKDITGGLPRVVELFEARKPREAAAVISEIDGIVKIGGVVKGQRKIMIVPEDGGEPREYSLPRGVHVNVQDGDRVEAGEQLMDGPSNPHDILAVLGEKELQRYLVNEIQEVYRLQGVNINDKHIEVITRQMMRWVRIEDVGDTEFLIDDITDRFRFLEENERVLAEGGAPAKGRPMLLGITKASLSTDSFISAASFQETTRVLTEASISGKVDHLRGLKENVTMGRLIPAGTGFDIYQHIRIPLDSPPPPPPSSPDDVDLERDIDYLADADDLLDRERGEILE
jgi:DNA-directed RNA polymerase subunit beta'